MAVLASVGEFITTWVDAATGRELVPLYELMAVAHADGLDVGKVDLLGALLRAGGEVLLARVQERDGDEREVVLVRLPEGWRSLCATRSSR